MVDRDGGSETDRLRSRKNDQLHRYLRTLRVKEDVWLFAGAFVSLPYPGPDSLRKFHSLAVFVHTTHHTQWQTSVFLRTSVSSTLVSISKMPYTRRTRADSIPICAYLFSIKSNCMPDKYFDV
jgi:hypothetical protein